VRTTCNLVLGKIGVTLGLGTRAGRIHAMKEK